jgi:hypothetical protein
MNAVADRLAIIELLDRHQITIDLGDADTYAELYAPDGRMLSAASARSSNACDGARTTDGKMGSAQPTK